MQYRARGGTWSTFADGTGVATTATVTGLTNYDEYEFRVAATTSAGTGDFGPSTGATPTDGNDPNDTFNYPDGALTDQANWVPIAPVYGNLQVSNGHAIGTGDRQGTGTAYAQPLGADLEVTIDALLGDDYNEVTVVLRMGAPTNLVGSYLLQWVTDGRYAAQGGIAGPTLQIWRVDAGPTFVLVAESSLPNHGERTLTFGANGSTLYIAEGSTVHLSHTDATYSTGDYIALGQSNLSGGAPSRIDNLRWRTLSGPPG